MGLEVAGGRASAHYQQNAVPADLRPISNPPLSLASAPHEQLRRQVHTSVVPLVFGVGSSETVDEIMDGQTEVGKGLRR